MPDHVDSPTPCGAEAKIWRECLKQFDYSPDRPKGTCEPQRGQYYDCMRDWKQKSCNEAYTSKQYELVPQCAKEAEKLHQCMMIGMFEVSRCQSAMLALKRCGYKHDPAIRSALSEDEALQIFNAMHDEASPTGWKWLWYKTIGKI